MNDFYEKMECNAKEEDFENISTVGYESNTFFTAIDKKTKETVHLFKCHQLSVEYAIQFINIYSKIKCDHILPIYKYYFRPCVTFITKQPNKGQRLTDILCQITEENKLTILLQIIDTVRIFQSFHIFSIFFNINSIYVDIQDNYNIQFCSIFPIYISQNSFSNLKMNTVLILNTMNSILGKEKVTSYFDGSNLYQPATKILYNLIKKISINNSTLNVDITKYQNYFTELIELANSDENENRNLNSENQESKKSNSNENQTKNTILNQQENTNEKSTNNSSSNENKSNSNEQENLNEKSTKNSNEKLTKKSNSNENPTEQDNSNEKLTKKSNLNENNSNFSNSIDDSSLFENRVLEAQYLCAISGINDKRYLSNLASKNHPEGQFLYGYRMMHGIGLRKDQIHGSKHIKNSADCNNGEAQLYYSILLKEGIGVRQNMNQSMNYLKLSSDNKNKEALVLYGNFISNTMPAISISCYKEATERGDIEGFFYFLFSSHQNNHIKKGNKSNSISSIINFNVTFCANIPLIRNSYKEYLNSISLDYLKLMLDGESYGQFLFGFFNKQIHSIFLNPILIEKFDIKEIYENDFIDMNDEIEDFYLDKSMKNGNLYSTYVYAKKLNKKGQIQLIFNYLKERKDSEYKNIKYFYAKCLQNMPISINNSKINEMIIDAAKNECFEAIFDEGENLTNSDQNLIYQAAKSGISEACLKYGKYIIKSNVNKGRYFLKLCANEIPEAEYVLSCYSENIESQMKHLKKAADKGFVKALHSYGLKKYNEGNIDEAIKYFKKDFSDSSSLLYLAHCLFLKTNKKIECTKYIKLAFESFNSFSFIPYGICLFYGFGLNKNENEAEKVFRQSASKFDFLGIYNLAVCMENGIGTKKMNKNDVFSYLINQKNNSKNKKKFDSNNKNILSTVLFESNSELGLSYIYLYLGYLLYYKGDLKEAKKYFKNAASKGNMTAAILYARCIEMTSNLRHKLCTALKIYHLVVTHLSSPSFASFPSACKLRRKAQLCEELLKRKLNVTNDIQVIKKIADEGDDQAQFIYGVYCIKMNEVKIDETDDLKSDKSDNSYISKDDSLDSKNKSVKNILLGDKKDIESSYKTKGSNYTFCFKNKENKTTNEKNNEAMKFNFKSRVNNNEDPCRSKFASNDSSKKSEFSFKGNISTTSKTNLNVIKNYVNESELNSNNNDAKPPKFASNDSSKTSEFSFKGNSSTTSKTVINDIGNAVSESEFNSNDGDDTRSSSTITAPKFCFNKNKSSSNDSSSELSESALRNDNDSNNDDGNNSPKFTFKNSFNIRNSNANFQPKSRNAFVSQTTSAADAWGSKSHEFNATNYSAARMLAATTSTSTSSIKSAWSFGTNNSKNNKIIDSSNLFTPKNDQAKTKHQKSDTTTASLFDSKGSGAHSLGSKSDLNKNTIENYSAKKSPSKIRPAESQIQKIDLRTSNNDSKSYPTAFSSMMEVANSISPSSKIKGSNIRDFDFSKGRCRGEAEKLKQEKTATAKSSNCDIQKKSSQKVLPNFSDGLRYLELSVASGNDKAEEFLARCLLSGEFVERDEKRALSLMSSSSEKGNAKALNNLGVLYKTGQVVFRDDRAAFELFKRSADLGSPIGLLHYAMCLMKGRGVEMNPQLALPALRKAREQGVPRASYVLGLYYLNGDPNGGVEGMKLVKEAANLGYKKAKFVLNQE